MSSPTSDIAALLRLCPLFHCCIPGSSVVSSRPSVHSWPRPLCRAGTAEQIIPRGQRPTFPGPTVALGQFLRFSAAPYSQTSVRGSVVSCPNRVLVRRSVEVLKVRRCFRNLHWGWLLPLRQASVFYKHALFPSRRAFILPSILS
jgi:hypothetical protein